MQFDKEVSLPIRRLSLYTLQNNNKNEKRKKETIYMYTFSSPEGLQEKAAQCASDKTYEEVVTKYK